MIRLKLGWSNPDTGPTSLRLYALDQGDQPRWAQPHARVAEVPLIEAGAKEGERYVLLAAEEYEVIRKIQDTRDALITTRDGYYAEIDHRRELEDQLAALRRKVGEWAERINTHDAQGDDFESANQRLLNVIYEMRDAAAEGGADQ